MFIVKCGTNSLIIMKHTFLILLTSLLALTTFSNTMPVLTHHQLVWDNLQEHQSPEQAPMRLHFEGANYENGNGNDPWFRKIIPINSDASAVEAVLLNPVYQTLTNQELLYLDNIAAISPAIKITSAVSQGRNKSYAIVSFLPLRLNMSTGKYEKLVAFDLELSPIATTKSGDDLPVYAANSVLATGNWYRIKLTETGIYKMTYAEMAATGMAVSGLNSANLRLYGNGGGMLPESNTVYREDDLQENAIQMVDGGDGVFGPGDYFLFYGQSPEAWDYNSNTEIFDHQKNIYSDYSYYFITSDLGPGKRIETLASTSEVANVNSTQFNDYALHETEDYNIIKSGRRWLGEVFDLQTKYNFNFSFPNLKTSVEQHLAVRTVGKSEYASNFKLTLNGVNVMTLNISPTSPNSPNGPYAQFKTVEERLSINSSEVALNLEYNKSSNNDIGWLDYIQMNVIRNLVFSGSQMGFRDAKTIGEGNISQYTLANAGSGITIWEVSMPYHAQKVNTTASGNNLNFRLPTNTLREFIAFDGTSFLSAEFDAQIPNQNLHAAKNIEYLIVSHPDFLDQANRLANFHREHSNLNVLVATPQQIYNEFSSGAQDITAIKDVVRMMYNRGQQGDVMPKFLLLFGDASYDFKDRVPDNTNFVPTFESPNSLHPINSYATDDYFGFLDPSEGLYNSDLLDVGIGRFVVATPEEATAAVDKVIHYATSELSMGYWRNLITFVADDEDNNSHLKQADELAVFVDTTYPDFNVNKIYIDAYFQETTAGGQRYPEVNEAINSSMEKGTFIMNYTGHGGEVGWGHERFLEIPDINKWANYDKLSVFITATCEFARYDDPGRTSAGELVFLNENGGGIALFTTARATYGTSNLNLNRGFYKYAFEKVDGEHYTMGDLIRLAKLESGSAENDKKFVLLGDPALKMAYTEHKVITTSIEQEENTSSNDTISALSRVTIQGLVTDEMENHLTNFNGRIHAAVYDKAAEVTTLGQDDGSSPRNFVFRKNSIYNGYADVNGGAFSFTFIVPKDIAYQYGNGKISYYANNETTDASGHDFDIIIGGYDDVAIGDNDGPEIRLYMNDTTFKNGDITHENPVLLAKVYDESGINTVGNSIGHDISAVLDQNTNKPYLLNDYYESDLKGFNSGTVSYPFSNLTPGEHTVTVRMWDVFNNSAEATLTFVVIDRDQIAINSAYNRPNPFSSETWFEFNHNQANEKLDVEIEIYDLSGRKLAVLQQNNLSSSFYPAPLRWDGTSADGRRLSGGIYIYRVQIKDAKGQSASMVKKLVISR